MSNVVETLATPTDDTDSSLEFSVYSSYQLSEEISQYQSSSDKNKNNLLFIQILQKYPDIKVKDFIHILTKNKVKISTLDFSFEYNGTKAIDVLLGTNNLRILINFLLRKPLEKSFVNALLDNPLRLHSLIYEIGNRGYFSFELVDSTVKKIFKIESEILSKNELFSISDFLTHLSEQKNFFLSLPCNEGKFKNIEFITNSIPNKNYTDTTLLKGKSINNTIFLLGYLFTSNALEIKPFLYDNELSILKKFNSQINPEYILKYFNLNLVTLKSLTNINNLNINKAKDLYNSSLLFIDLNSDNSSFMTNPIVGELLDILGNSNVSNYLKKMSTNEFYDQYFERFEENRREMMEKRLMHIIANTSKTDETENDRTRRKI